MEKSVVKKFEKTLREDQVAQTNLRNSNYMQETKTQTKYRKQKLTRHELETFICL